MWGRVGEGFPVPTGQAHYNLLGILGGGGTGGGGGCGAKCPPAGQLESNSSPRF
jgi:hypothetical protein